MDWLRMPTPENQMMAAALKVPLYESDLLMPEYRAGEFGEWRLMVGGGGLDRGFHSGMWFVPKMPILMRRKEGRDWETWMSLSVHEIESQELGCRHAFGTTVVMGLGMGWIALNAATRPEVDRVIVIERDPAVIELFHESGAAESLSEALRGKIEIVEADALVWQPLAPVDFLYADIWLTLAEPETLEQVRRMQANVRARQVYFWGQEITLFARSAACREAGEAWTMDLVRRCAAEQLGLPLLLPEGIGYPEMIDRVVASRRARGLPVR